MSDEEIDASDKPYEPSKKKLDDARKKGEVASSADLTASAAYGGMLLAGLALGGTAMTSAAGMLSVLIDQAPGLSDAVFAGSGPTVSGGILLKALQTSWVWFVFPAVLALVAIFAQRAMVFAPEKLQPKLSRISLISNAKQKFGRNGLFEFAKSFTKLAIYGATLGVFIWVNLPDIVVTVSMAPGAIVAELFRLAIAFFAIVFVIALAIGGVDFLWQHAEHLRKNRMSHKELMDETKENEGDPWLKSERRQRGYDIATNRMLDDVPGADVVIVNPTHYAIALTWDRAGGRAPVCVAKGVDDVAARIRSRAAEAGVPIRRDPPTARALHASIDIGDEIHPEHYRPVAAAIRFAEAMRARAGGRRQ